MRSRSRSSSRRNAVNWSILSACPRVDRSEEHTSELQSRENLVCRLLLEKKNNHADIESVSVSKDAACTAIYGCRAANGVVLVTTKGATEGKLRVSNGGYDAIQ